MGLLWILVVVEEDPFFQSSCVELIDLLQQRKWNNNLISHVSVSDKRGFKWTKLYDFKNILTKTKLLFGH